MKKLLSTFVFAAVVSSPTFAENGHRHADKNQSMSSGMMMGMMNHEQMMAMHEHMQKMYATMAKIKAEIDPEKRQKLVNEHMRSMQEGMQMMNKGMGMHDVMDKTSHPGNGMSEKMDDMDMKKRVEMMEERMGMMQMMMGQMMDHESEAKKFPVHKHKK